MEQNKTGKYLKYAIGEIVLVMVGILLALQVNNWNQNRLNEILEQQLLKNLLSDIEIDINNLMIGDSIASLSVSAKNKILGFIKGEELSQDSIFYFTAELGPTNQFIPTTVTFEEMKNSDSFKVIQSQILRREISVLYSQYKKLEDYENKYHDSRLRLQNIRIEDFSTASQHEMKLGNIKDPNQVIEQIKTNRKFKNALTSNYAQNRNLIYKETLQLVRDFKLKLQEYIKQ